MTLDWRNCGIPTYYAVGRKFDGINVFYIGDCFVADWSARALDIFVCGK